MSAAPEINSSISLLWEDTCWTALIVPSSLSAASRYASPIVCLFLFCPLKYSHKFTKGTCSPRPRWGTITQWKNMVKISKGSAVRQGRGINRVMISPEFLPRAGVTRKQRKWWHILTQDPGKSNPDILFRARDSSSANYRGKRRARFSFWDYDCVLCQNSLDRVEPGAQRNYLYMNSSRFGSNALHFFAGGMNGHGWRQRERKAWIQRPSVRFMSISLYHN